MTLRSHEVVSKCFLLNEKPDISSEINGFIYDKGSEFRLFSQLMGDIK